MNNNAWKCPYCNKSYANENQMHSCEVHTVEELLNGKYEETKELYNLLVKFLSKLGNVKINVNGTSIHFSNAGHFSAVQIKKDKLRFNFVTDEEIFSERFVKFNKFSKNRMDYVVEIFNEKDLDDELFEWLRHAYELKG